MNVDFNFPQIHSFPPFFTRQLHEETWRKQLKLWIDLLLSYATANKIFELDLRSETTYLLPLFYNPQIDRRMDPQFLSEIFDEIVREGRGSWISSSSSSKEKGKQQVILLYWRNPQEWANEIYRFVRESGGVGTIYTIYDLIEGDDTLKEDFHDLPDTMMKLAITELERTGRAKMLNLNNNNETATTSVSSCSSFKENGLKFY